MIGHLLLKACRRCDLAMVKRLLNSADDVHKTTSAIITAPGIAAITSSTEPPLPSIPGESTATKKAASHANPTSCGTPDLIHFRHPFTGDTTLHMAATAVVKVERSKDEESGEGKPISPTSVALVSQRRQLIEFLISRCVSLENSACSMKLNLLFLFSRGANLCERNAEGRTSLHVAAASGCVEAILTLAQHGAPVNATDGQGYSPLHLASANGHAVAVRLLLDSLGADRSLTTAGCGGRTALQLAASDRVRRMFLEPTSTTVALATVYPDGGTVGDYDVPSKSSKGAARGTCRSRVWSLSCCC